MSGVREYFCGLHCPRLLHFSCPISKDGVASYGWTINRKIRSSVRCFAQFCTSPAFYLASAPAHTIIYPSPTKMIMIQWMVWISSKLKTTNNCNYLPLFFNGNQIEFASLPRRLSTNSISILHLPEDTKFITTPVNSESTNRTNPTSHSIIKKKYGRQLITVDGLSSTRSKDDPCKECSLIQIFDIASVFLSPISFSRINLFLESRGCD